jgi:hypothetical protein
MPLINDSEESLDGVRGGRAQRSIVLQRRSLVPEALRRRFSCRFSKSAFRILVRRYRERFEKAAYLKGHYPEMIAERVALSEIRGAARDEFTEPRA